MSEGWAVSLIALFGVLCTVTSPMILAYLTSRTNRATRAEAAADAKAMREEDWARQDAVAARVTGAANLLAKQNELVAAATEVTQTKLDEVHKIVNQQRTDMLRYQAVLLAALEAAGVPVPADASITPPAQD